MQEPRAWIHRRRSTLGLIMFFVGWYVLQLSVLHFFGWEVAQWWFYLEKPPDIVSPGVIFGPISHDMATITHLGANIFFLFIVGGIAEPYIVKKKFLYIVFGLSYLGTFLANATAPIHNLWILAGASGGILAFWAYAGLKLRHLTFESRKEPESYRKVVEQIGGVVLILGIPAFLLQEAVLRAQFHSGHVIGLLLGCGLFGYEYFLKRSGESTLGVSM